MNFESYLNKARDLRPPSQAVVKLLGLLDRPDLDTAEVVSTVGSDAVLTAKLLAVCNSASYGLPESVASVSQGVLILGYSQIHRLIMAISFGERIGREVPGYDMEAGELWKHSVLSAILTPKIVQASTAFKIDPSIAYTAGLLHDLGKTVLATSIDLSAQTAIRNQVEHRGLTLREAERAVLGCDHAELGAHILRMWRIPETIVEAVEYHHRPPVEKPSLATAVHLSDAIAHQSGASPGWNGMAIKTEPRASFALGLSPEELQKMPIVVFDAQAEVAQMLESTLGSGPNETNL